MSTFLQRILARKRVELAERRAAVPEAALERLAAAAPPPRDFLAALEPDRLGVIAEVKRASPSKGAIALDLDAVTQTRRYAEGGADAISVLTDEEFYHGSLDDLRAIRATVRADNQASRRLFESCGFALQGSAEPGFLRYVRQVEDQATGRRKQA